MAVAFDVITTDKITVTNPQTLGAGSAFTFYQWFKRTVAVDPDAGTGTTKGGGTDIFIWLPFGIDAWSCYVARATTNAERRSQSNMMPLNTWAFIATTYSEANGARMFFGTLTAPVVEATYVFNDAGSGNTSADAGDLWINNRGASASASMGGDLAVAAWFDREFTLQELISHQWKPRNANGCQFFFNPYQTGTIPDLSGNQRNGAGTGLALANHVPLGRIG